ncbi:MAG TPA: ABC transporter ATP-binding protein [Polyangiaceae bacterium]|nr:ABC transporter ATP-binding protein [Polyangiaceae bacterium]
MSTPLLSVRDLVVEYVTPRGNVRAVDGVSFDIQRGQVFGLAGESGSGKSTAAMAAMRLLQAPALITGGQVLYEGRDVLDMSEDELRAFRWKKVALVFQSALNALNPVMTIGAQIADVIETHEKAPRARALERAAELLKLVGIESSRLGSYPHQLSGGMRQRVVIAIALALNPPLLFMDEPTTALDVVVQKEILQQIGELKQKLGFSILFITHDLSLMLEFCDQVGILYAGRLCEVAPAKQLFGSPQHPYTRGLMNSFPALHGPKRRQEGIGGSPPDMRNPPAGCRFHPRCPDANDRCRSETPSLLSLDGGRVAACHRVEERGASAQPSTAQDPAARAPTARASQPNEPGSEDGDAQ